MMYFSFFQSSLLIIVDFQLEKTKFYYFYSTKEIWVNRKTGKGKGEESIKVTQTYSWSALRTAQEKNDTSSMKPCLLQ